MVYGIGDRVRVVQFFKQNTGGMIGATGKITRVNRGKGDYVFSYIVQMDSVKRLYANTAIHTSFEFLMYPEELEWEDNRQGAITGELIANPGDYVRQDVMNNCEAKGLGDPLFWVYELWTPYRKGDTSLVVRCLGCGEIAGQYSPIITPANVNNVMYMHTEPSLEPVEV